LFLKHKRKRKGSESKRRRRGRRERSNLLDIDKALDFGRKVVF